VNNLVGTVSPVDRTGFNLHQHFLFRNGGAGNPGKVEPVPVAGRAGFRHYDGEHVVAAHSSSPCSAKEK